MIAEGRNIETKLTGTTHPTVVKVIVLLTSHPKGPMHLMQPFNNFLNVLVVLSLKVILFFN